MAVWPGLAIGQPVQVSLQGERAIWRTPTGDLISVFDREKQPRLVVQGTRPEELTVFIGLDGQDQPVQAQVQRLASAFVLRPQIALEEGASWIALRRGSQELWRGTFQWGQLPSRVPCIAEAERLRKTDEGERALTHLARCEPHLPLWARAWAEKTRTRVLADRGDIDGAIRSAKLAAEIALATDVPSEAVARLQAAAFYATQAERLVDAERSLDSAQALATALNFVDGMTAGHYFRGQLKRKQGRYLEATTAFKAAIHADVRTGLGTYADHARLELAGTLTDLGLHEEAQAAYGQIANPYAAPPDELSNPCLAATVAEDFAWTQIRAVDAGSLDGSTTLGINFLLSYSALLRGRCPKAHSQTILHTNRATFGLLSNDLARVRSNLAELQYYGDLGENVWRDVAYLRAELHLRSGETDAALMAFARQALRREPSGGRDERWRAHWGLARVWRARGEGKRASGALADAYEWLVRYSDEIPVRTGRTSYRMQRSALLGDYLRTLCDMGDIARAFEVIERENASVFRSLTFEQLQGGNATWRDRLAQYRTSVRRLGDHLRTRDRQAKNALPAWRRRAKHLAGRRAAAFEAAEEFLRGAGLHAQTISLAQVQAGLRDDDGLIAFLIVDSMIFVAEVSRRSVTVSTVLAKDARALIQRSMTRFRHLYIVPSGLNEARGLCAQGPSTASYLPFAGIVTRGHGRPPRHGSLVVVDPQANLSAAASEARAITPFLLASRVLAEGAATRYRVLEALRDVDVFHFAGHGQLGGDPWETRLLLADDTSLSLADILVERTAPRLVVLAGCKTGARSERRGARLGLADAFLVAGAQTVVVATTDVADEHAKEFSTAFYRRGGLRRPAAALKDAVDALAPRWPESQTTFEVWGRPVETRNRSEGKRSD